MADMLSRARYDDEETLLAEEDDAEISAIMVDHVCHVYDIVAFIEELYAGD